MAAFLLRSFLGFIFCSISIAKQPNIVLILSDDLGWNDLNFQSHQINTPNINKLVSEGQFLEWHYAQSICSPSRAALMTGRYPLHTGINDWIQPTQTFGVPLNNTMLPAILQQHGYATHMVGKWHLGMFQWPYTPTFRGFQSFYGYYTGGEDYYTHKNNGMYDFRNDIGVNCGVECSQVEIEAYGLYSAPLFSQRAVEIITSHSSNADTRDQPLFLYLAYQSVHSSNNGSSPAECPSFWVDPYNASINSTKRRVFAGMVSCMDSGIGNVTAALDKFGYLGEDGNTIIAFSADNGGPTTTGDGVGSSNWPLRGGKHSIWEGGTRVTAWMWATQNLIPHAGNAVIGKNYTQLMHLVDWMPTLLEAADITHEFPVGLELDGVSHWQGLTNGNELDDQYFHFRDNVYYGYDDNASPKNVAYRKEWFKILNRTGGKPDTWSPNCKNDESQSGGQKLELWQNCTPAALAVNKKQIYDVDNITLYDLYHDYAERNEISAAFRETVEELLLEMIALQATGIPQATGNESCSPASHPEYPVVGAVWEPWC